MNIYSLPNPEEKEEIFKLRYRVYIEELGKNHIQSNDLNRTISDEFDEGCKYFFAKNNQRVCGALRVIIFNEELLKKLSTLYKLPVTFLKEVDINSIGFVDRFVIDKEYRNGILGLKLMMQLYTYTLNLGICYGFINAEKSLVHTYYQIGYWIFRAM